MNKAFLFDMDGVLVDSEPSWEAVEREYLPKLFGQAIVDKMPNLVGAGLEKVLESATALGAVYERADALEMYEEIAQKVYEHSPLTPGVDKLIDRLDSLSYKLGLVTQSPHTWVDQVVPRLPYKDHFGAIVSLHEHPELRRKPDPDGFLATCKLLNADPTKSIVLEDSNVGIQAAKTAGCHTIGYRGNLTDGYEQTGADAYADTMDDVIKLVELFDRN